MFSKTPPFESLLTAVPDALSGVGKIVVTLHVDHRTGALPRTGGLPRDRGA